MNIAITTGHRMINSIAFSHLSTKIRVTFIPKRTTEKQRLNTINSTKTMKPGSEPRNLKQMPTAIEKRSDQSRLSINSPLSTSTLLEFKTE